MPGALSSDCRFPHAPGRVGSGSVGSSEPSGWQAALPSTPSASGSQLSLGRGWHSLSLTPLPTLLWALVLPAWGPGLCGCPCPQRGASFVLGADPLGQKQKTKEDPDGLVAVSGILK